MYNIAMLYAHWFAFGEGAWNTPKGVQDELESRGHQIQVYNLYHENGRFDERHKTRRYSNESINTLYKDFNSGYKPDAIFLMDYGCWNSVAFDKKYFSGVVLISEQGDEPQSARTQWPKAQQAHAVLSPDWPCVDLYNNAGYKAIWWTHWADERVFYPRSIQPQFDCVTTCGSRKYTAEIQSTLGERFNNERYFYGNAHAERLHLGKMCFQNSQHSEWTRRVPEAMACGRIVLTDRLPAAVRMQDYFVDEQDIIYYNDAKDAIDKINYFASHDTEREAIAANGYKKVMEGHTVKQRVDVLEDLIKEIKLTL